MSNCLVPSIRDLENEIICIFYIFRCLCDNGNNIRSHSLNTS